MAIHSVVDCSGKHKCRSDDEDTGLDERGSHLSGREERCSPDKE